MINRRKYTKEEFEEAVRLSYSIAEVLRRLDLTPAGGNYKEFHKTVKLWEVDCDHFTGKGHLKGKTHNWSRCLSLEECLVDGSSIGSNRLKKKLLKVGIFQNICSICKIQDWLEKPLVMHLDHISGNPFDNRLENLRLLCPNCHSQTDTYVGKNRKCNISKEIQKEKERIKNQEKQRILNRYNQKEENTTNKDIEEIEKVKVPKTPKPPKPPKERRQIIVRVSICNYCKKEFNIPAGRTSQKFCGYDCMHLSQRKVEHPSRQDLIDDLSHMSICAIGRKYGVSDNAIRKWMRGFGI